MGRMRTETSGIVGVFANPLEKERLRVVSDRAEKFCGKARISGRYHRLPRRIEDDYVISDKAIGKGISGFVRLGKCRHTGGSVAIKSFKLTRREAWFENESGRIFEWKDRVAREVEMALLMDHPKVARLLEVYESERKLKIVTEYLGGGTLFQHAHRRCFIENEAARAAHDMLLALNYLHSQGIVHRDLKPANFVYERKEGNLKLIDFGFSKHVEPDEMMIRCVGTVGYKAPEVLQRWYSCKCDLWSLGVIIFRLLTGHNPFPGATREQINEKVRTGAREIKSPSKWAGLSVDARDFVDRLLAPDPGERLTVTDALQHPWILAHFESRSGLVSLEQHFLDGLRCYARVPQFQRACMQLMVWSLSAEERDEVLNVFHAMDQHQDGQITIAMFHDALLTANCKVSEAECVELFHALDSYRNGTTLYSQLLAAKLSSRSNFDDILFKVTFNRVDNDKKGYITAKSLRGIIGDIFEGMSVEHVFAQADVGGIGYLSYDRFAAYLRQSYTAECAPVAGGKQLALGGC